jgi:two-component system phosphate regulon sensor histidine kinase PhoR
MVEGVLLLDRDGRVVLANQALKKMMGVSSDPVGKTVMESLRWHELPELIKSAAAQGQVLGYEINPPGMEHICLQANATQLKEMNGRPYGMMLVLHDLTHVKKLENTRKEFVANVSHELRTPLSIIKGYVETLLDGAREDPDVLVRFLQIIDKHTNRLTFLIEDLLTLSRLESGQIALNCQALDLKPLVSRVLDDLNSSSSVKKITVQNQVPENLIAFADADRMHQVLMNLIDNAIKYGREEGLIVVTGNASEKGIEIAVRDNGPGIPPEARERVFERFYRIDKARAREQGGTGLGLAIVKHIVQSHGGKAWVESEPGKGAAFFFSLPANRK